MRSIRPWASSMIAGLFAQARGRSERAFRTLQDRLPKELRLAGIATIEAANCWLSETYIGEHKPRLRGRGRAGRQRLRARPGRPVAQTLCVHEERTVGNDNTVKWRNHALQLPPSPLRPPFVKAQSALLEDPDGRVSIFLGRIIWPITTPPAPSSRPNRRRAQPFRDGRLRPGACPGPAKQEAVNP